MVATKAGITPALTKVSPNKWYILLLSLIERGLACEGL